jgi:hypothetical protein
VTVRDSALLAALKTSFLRIARCPKKFMINREMETAAMAENIMVLIVTVT